MDGPDLAGVVPISQFILVYRRLLEIGEPGIGDGVDLDWIESVRVFPI